VAQVIGPFEKNQDGDNHIPLLLKQCKIILAEDHVRFRRFIKSFLETEGGLEVVGEADDGMHLLEIINSCRPDLIILDINMPRVPGLEAARRIKELYPGIKVLILTMHNNKEYLQEAMALGAEGFLLKERVDTELIDAIKKIINGGIYITPLMACL
jgi:DNA-binding NarL/FixJ family response regulator